MKLKKQITYAFVDLYFQLISLEWVPLNLFYDFKNNMFILENIKKYKDKMNPDTTKINILVVTTEFFTSVLISLPTIEVYGYIALQLLFNVIYFKYLAL